MSFITDAVIVADYVCEQVKVRLTEPIAADTERHQHFVQMGEVPTGGSKVFCDDVYLAAFNYLGIHELEPWFEALPWRTCDRAVLTAATEGQDGLTIVVVNGKVISKTSWHEDYYGNYNPAVWTPDE